MSKLADEPVRPSKLQFWIVKLNGTGGWLVAPGLIKMGTIIVSNS
jgi:hypothetical protein